MPIRRVLAIDPGRRKCGLAVVDREAGLLERRVLSAAELPQVAREWCGRYHPDLLLLGAGTGSRALLNPLAEFTVPLRRVPERETTRQARGRYFAEHPPRGWRRLLPLSLQTPPVPVDDYAAWIIAEQFLTAQPVDEPSSEGANETSRKIGKETGGREGN